VSSPGKNHNIILLLINLNTNSIMLPVWSSDRQRHPETAAAVSSPGKNLSINLTLFILISTTIMISDLVRRCCTSWIGSVSWASLFNRNEDTAFAIRCGETLLLPWIGSAFHS
jgi:hypothetical protein